MRLVHPTLSTITYLTDVGAPTLILNVTCPDGNRYQPRVPDLGVLLFPQENKHVTFRGDLLHGVVGPLGRRNPNHDTRRPRITFLVNWWSTAPGPPNCRELSPGDVILYARSSGKLAASVLSSWTNTRSESKSPMQLPVVTARGTDPTTTILVPTNERLHLRFPATVFPAGASLELIWRPGVGVSFLLRTANHGCQCPYSLQT